MTLRPQIALLILIAHAVSAQPRKATVKADPRLFTNVSYPQAQYQVITPDQVKSIYQQEQSLADIRERLGSIEQSINEVKVDVKSLKETDIVVNFILGAVRLLVPGLIIAAFSIWFAARLKSRGPERGSPAI